MLFVADSLQKASHYSLGSPVAKVRNDLVTFNMGYDPLAEHLVPDARVQCKETVRRRRLRR